MRITGGIKITGGLKINSINNVNGFTTAGPTSWASYLVDMNTIITGNTLITDGTGSGVDFVFQDASVVAQLITLFGDPGSNNGHGGLFQANWSAGSTSPTTGAFIELYTGNFGPAPINPGEYAIYVQIIDNSYMNPIAGIWNFPATFTLDIQIF